MTRHDEIKAAIIDHYRNNFAKGVNFKTLGTDWNEGQPIYDELFAEGTLVEVKLPSKSGKRMMWKIVLRTQAEELGLEIY